MRRVRYIRNIGCAVMIQSAWRAHVVMNEILLARRYAAQLIQRQWRTFQIDLLQPVCHCTSPAAITLRLV